MSTDLLYLFHVLFVFSLPPNAKGLGVFLLLPGPEVERSSGEWYDVQSRAYDTSFPLLSLSKQQRSPCILHYHHQPKPHVRCRYGISSSINTTPIRTNSQNLYVFFKYQSVLFSGVNCVYPGFPATQLWSEMSTPEVAANMLVDSVMCRYPLPLRRRCRRHLHATSVTVEPWRWRHRAAAALLYFSVSQEPTSTDSTPLTRPNGLKGSWHHLICRPRRKHLKCLRYPIHCTGMSC